MLLTLSLLQPCGTGALDGGHERSTNFKKVLDTMFSGSPPEVSGSITSSNLNSPSSPSLYVPSLPSQTIGGKWYPDYNPIWAEGLCSNAHPAPSGRPHYDSDSECCAKAYGNQASGVCVGLIPSSPEIPSNPSSSTSDLTATVSITSQPVSKPSLTVEGPTSPTPDLSTLILVTTEPTSKPVASFSIEEISSFSVEETDNKWYPDYNSIWALGKCDNISPAPSGRPHHNSQSECCKMAYGGQASGACVGYTTSTVSKLETYYPDYNVDWSLGKCSNAYPAPGGRPQYNSQKECCEKAYAGQSSLACISDVPLATENTIGEFYPNYNSLFSKGICTNEAPLPQGRPIYSSQAECCEFAYRGQASGACVNHVPGDDTDKVVSFAESFTSEFMAPHAVLRSNFITFSCDESNTFPFDTAIMDILFDYEVSLPQNVQAKHALPSLKKEIMDGLASSLNCQIVTQRRGLRKTDDGVLLGFQSVDGSDVINGEKGSCSRTQEMNGERCYPIIGHIAAVLKFEATSDEVLVVKNVCTNEAPLPQGRPIYSSQAECCEFAYRGQASGACVNHVPGDDTDKVVSFAESFTSEFMAPHAVLRSNFITFSCDESNTFPFDTAIMDILFDYEVSLPQNVQAKHALPSLKKEIMDGLASSLNCQIVTQRRGLRKTDDGVLLGFQSVDGSDVINGEKGSCSRTQEMNGERCYPIIGHIAAVLKFEATSDEVLVVKNDVLKNIRHMMERNSISDFSGKYVNEHDVENLQQAQVSNAEAEVTTDSGSRTWVAVVCCLLGIAFGVALTLFVTKRRRIAQMIKSRTHNADSDSICGEEICVEETAHTNFSLSSRDASEHRSGSSSVGSDCCDPSSANGSVDQTSHLHHQDKWPGSSLGRYISNTSNNPSISIYAGANNSVQPSVDSECVRQNAQIALAMEDAVIDLMRNSSLPDDDVDEAHDATTIEADEIDANHAEEDNGVQGVLVEKAEQVYENDQNFVLVGDSSSVYARFIDN